MTLDTHEITLGDGPAWTVLWLHGLGADGHDFAPIVPVIARDGWPSVRFVFPHAPIRPVTINGGYRMRAWYDIVSMDLADRADVAGVLDSVAQVDELIAAEVARGVPESQIILAGFSQGGAIALDAGVRRKTPLAGVIGLSTYLPRGAGVLDAATDAARTQPFFAAHGRQDPVVPFAAGRASANALVSAGFNLQWHEYPMQHAVCDQELADLSDWLTARFSTA